MQNCMLPPAHSGPSGDLVHCICERLPVSLSSVKPCHSVNNRPPVQCGCAGVHLQLLGMSRQRSAKEHQSSFTLGSPVLKVYCCVYAGKCRAGMQPVLISQRG
jgi:hypothetical protein